MQCDRSTPDGCGWCWIELSSKIFLIGVGKWGSQLSQNAILVGIKTWLLKHSEGIPQHNLCVLPLSRGSSQSWYQGQLFPCVCPGNLTAHARGTVWHSLGQPCCCCTPGLSLTRAGLFLIAVVYSPLQGLP